MIIRVFGKDLQNNLQDYLAEMCLFFFFFEFPGELNFDSCKNLTGIEVQIQTF